MTDEPPIVQATREFLEACDRTPNRLIFPTNGLYGDMFDHSDPGDGSPPTFDGIPIWFNREGEEPYAVFREEVPING